MLNTGSNPVVVLVPLGLYGINKKPPTGGWNRKDGRIVMLNEQEALLSKYGTEAVVIRSNIEIGHIKGSYSDGKFTFIREDSSDFLVQERDVIKMPNSSFIVLSCHQVSSAGIFTANIKTQSELEHMAPQTQNIQFGDVAGNVMAGNHNIGDFSTKNITLTEVLPEITSSTELTSEQQLELIQLMTEFSSEKEVKPGYFGKFSTWIENHQAALQFVSQIATQVLLRNQ